MEKHLFIHMVGLADPGQYCHPIVDFGPLLSGVYKQFRWGKSQMQMHCKR